jgi:iron-sulfur cluster assembly protein
MKAEKSYQIFVSTKAAEQIKLQLQKRGAPAAYLRLGIRGGGCSGFSYVLQFEDAAPKVKDLIFEIEGVRIIVDSKSIIYLNGSTLDWEHTLMNQGYKFINPQEKSKCGCGTSFTV